MHPEVYCQPDLFSFYTSQNRLEIRKKHRILIASTEYFLVVFCVITKSLTLELLDFSIFYEG